MKDDSPQPLVSAVIPSFNHSRFVREAVDSALSQTNCRVEVIVVDDGSTDNTRETLAPYGSRINYIFQQNKGLSAARNTGIKAARGEWVAVLDSDDAWHPQKTELQLAAASANPAASVVGSPGNRVQLPMSATLPSNPSTSWLDVRDFLLNAPMSASSTMIRAHCFQEVGLFDESLRSAEDRDMWLRLAVRYQVLQVDSPCWFYRHHEGQMSRDPQRMYLNFRAVLDRFFSAHPEYSDLKAMAYSFLYQDAAICFGEANRKLTAALMMARSIQTHRRAFGPQSMSRSKWLVGLLVPLQLKHLIKAMVRRG